MADFEIIEADFQQYYHLDVSALGFRRYARLLLNLPAESRLVQKYSPFKDWNWDKEMQSQILRELNVISTNYVNAHRKKGVKKVKFQKQLEPMYVTNAKKEMRKENGVSEEQKIKLEEFFSKKNNKVKKLGEITNEP